MGVCIRSVVVGKFEAPAQPLEKVRSSPCITAQFMALERKVRPKRWRLEKGYSVPAEVAK